MALLRTRLVLLTLGASALLVGCGGKSKTAGGKTTSPAPVATVTATTPAPTQRSTGSAKKSAGPSPSPLTAEATSAAAGDIPDNQVFITFRDAAAGYSMRYPEGWVQQGSGRTVTFRDKNNIVRVVVSRGSHASGARIRRGLAALQGVRVQTGPQPLKLVGNPAIKVVYTTESAPNSVTGKRVTLVVDRYYLARAGKEAVVDLGTPQGVDNVDAYRLMIESFRWS
jgi:hypothetical protein